MGIKFFQYFIKKNFNIFQYLSNSQKITELKKKSIDKNI
jgi:hypothetical protein